MASDLSSSGISFKTLAKDSGFLNEIIHNISSCVLLLNNKMELQAYNNSIKTIFSNKKDEHLLYQRCGEAIGCAYTVEEKKRCGETSKCKYCELRESGLSTYLNKEPVYKKQIEREFFKTASNKVLKHLQFSTRPFRHKKELYVIMIIEDITEWISQEKLIKFQQEKLKEMLSFN